MFDEYEARIFHSFDVAKEFFTRHKRPRTAKDWDMIDLALGDYRDEFTGDLITAVTEELQRESIHAVTRLTLDAQGAKKVSFEKGGIFHDPKPK